MAKLTFKASDLTPILEHAAANGGEVFLVHDHGVYLMSAGKPGLLREPKVPGGVKHIVAYANGMNPDTDEDWWDRARDAVGGDDFGETLPWAPQMLRAIREGATRLHINMTAKSMSFTHNAPRPKVDIKSPEAVPALVKASKDKTIFLVNGKAFQRPGPVSAANLFAIVKSHGLDAEVFYAPHRVWVRARNLIDMVQASAVAS